MPKMTHNDALTWARMIAKSEAIDKFGLTTIILYDHESEKYWLAWKRESDYSRLIEIDLAAARVIVDENLAKWDYSTMYVKKIENSG